MDYFSEIASNPDVHDAVTGLGHDADYPSALQAPYLADKRLYETHSSMWRAELVHWFHRYPGFAAKVWRALGAGQSERTRLMHEVRAASWLQARRVNPVLKPLELSVASSEKEFRQRWPAATPEQLEAVRGALGAESRYPGPEFIEKLLAEDSSLAADPDMIADLIAHPEKVRALARKHQAPVPFAMVHQEELAQVATYRSERGDAGPARPSGAPLRQALAMNLVGVAFSGGGIRSATFNLGVLQALAKLDLLRHCDYLSTVSGGGYIGSWFTAWTQREGPTPSQLGPLGARQAQDRMRLRLSPTRSPHPLDRGVRPIRYLREFSNYLTPKTGVFSADTWTMIAIYIRNLLLNLLVLIPLIAASLLVAHMVFSVTWPLFNAWSGRTPFAWQAWTMLGILVPALLVVLILNLRRSARLSRTGGVGEGPRAAPPWYARQGWIQLGVVLPLLVVAVLIAAGYWSVLHVPQRLGNAALNSADTIRHVAHVAGVVFLAYLALIHIVGSFQRFWSTEAPFGRRRGRGTAAVSLIVATVGGAGAGLGIFWLLGKVLLTFDSGEAGFRAALTFGTPLVLTAYSTVVAIQLGLLGTKFPDEQREWWSRLRAWTLIYSLAWLGLFTMALWVPSWICASLMSAGGLGALGVWALSTFAGIQAGRSGSALAKDGAGAMNAPAAKKAPALSERGRGVVLLVAPYVFIVGLLALVALAIHVLLARNFERALGDVASYPVGTLLGITVALLVVSLLVSWRIGVNEFSLHNFYKNRLVRCYLGASRWQVRKADWFTGFDAEDDIDLSRLDHEPPPDDPTQAKYPGPYPIVNATLNLVGGKDLAWQERKASSFVFTPKYCGYDADRAVLQQHRDGAWPDAYAPSRAYVNEGRGPTLGTAMAISGAAANPNMGKVTSAASAFLMTVFNVRLGSWLPNPRRKGFWWDRTGPVLGIGYTAVELFGMTDDDRTFVNVSDGGHFENLGVYELIRRGCRNVIVSDAGQDGAFGLEDLGNLIRKCRTDFGVEIEIGTDSIRDRSLKGWSHTHCVVGRIHYLNVPEVNDQGQVVVGADGQLKHVEGLLVYLKPSITGDEPFDVLEYYQRVPEFPHESTADQWFNESQFESYRRLGLHVAETTLRRFREQPDAPIEADDLFTNLKDFWYPRSPTIAEHATDHTAEYSRIMEQLRSNNTLSTLDRVLFHEVPANGLAAQRDEFYLCNALIQLIENVYADLDLEQNHDHPHVRGWMSVFEQWVRQEAFRRTWKISKSTYAPRFQLFYRDRLGGGGP